MYVIQNFKNDDYKMEGNDYIIVNVSILINILFA